MKIFIALIAICIAAYVLAVVIIVSLINTYVPKVSAESLTVTARVENQLQVKALPYSTSEPLQPAANIVGL